MSSDGNRIICRQCRESISLDNESCPNCGKSIRRTGPYVVGVVLGGILALAGVYSVISPNVSGLLVYGVLGLLVAGSSAYMIYEKRQRIREASIGSQGFEG